MSNSQADSEGVPSARDNLRAVQKWLRREMAGRGFTRIRTTDTWRRGTPASGWLIVERQTSRERGGGARYFTLGAAVWPVGTWESELAVSFARHVEADEPERGGATAPYCLSPSDFAGVSTDWFIPGHARADEAIGFGGNWWEVDAGALFDVAGLESRVSGFLDAVDGAWSQLLEPEHAIDVLVKRPHARSLRFAAAIMDASGMRDQQFQDLIEKLSDIWIADPRPATFRASLVDLRAKAGLSEIPLPNPPHTLI